MDPYVGEIRIFGFNYAPRGWMFCNGQIIAIQQNTALFAILGTTYGGNGTTNFGLPALNGLATMSAGEGQGLSDYTLGDTSGVTDVTLNVSEIPAHIHTLTAGRVNPPNPAQNVAMPGNTTVLGMSAPGSAYSTTNTVPTTFAPVMITPTGGNLPHSNQQPYLALNFCISMQGVFPPRN